jgi:predicted dehydrogenase
LVEKPLATSTEDLDGLVAAAADRLMVGYNLRLHAPLERVTALVRGGHAGEVSSYRLWFGSWLPDWRPNVDYRATYSAQRALGGGVLLDAIHELDVLLWLAGDDRFSVLGAVVDRLGPLEIDVEDTVKTLLQHASGAVAAVELDYLSRRYRRGVEVIGDKATIRLDWSRQVVEIAEAVLSEPATTPVLESYERQADRFLAFVAGQAPAPVDAAEGARSVALADAIRRAALR